jgi:hypothetical protein
MSRLTEIQDQYQSYIATMKEAEKINPGEKVEVVYKDGLNGGSDEGLFIYHPGRNQIVIQPRRCMYGESVCINVDDAPALIKALREFFE